MAMKFTACYPTLPSGVRTPCGLLADRQTGILQELVCPEIPKEACRLIVSAWNDRLPAKCTGSGIEEELAQFISQELIKQ